MKKKLLQFIVCPKCKKKLKLKVKKIKSREIKEGNLRCNKCDKNYPIVGYIPRFVDSDKYVGNFSFEWHIHQTTQLDSYNKNRISGQTFKEKTGFEKKDLKGKLTLDVGCGMGRFMEVAADQGSEIIGIDLSTAIEVARNNLKSRKKCHFIQADLFNLPFKNKSFDAIYSIGVLHHTPNTKKAFMQLPSLLRRKGRLAIWVYGKNTFDRYDTYFGGLLRRIGYKLPKRLVYLGCHLAVVLYWTYKIPILGPLINLLFPYSTDPNPRWRILDTFDWYSPKYQWKHTYPEVIGWYKEADLKIEKILKWEASVLGNKI